jgi:hypothetical protein
VYKEYSEALRKLDKVNLYNPGFLTGGEREKIGKGIREPLK